jgi:hypothetical protein
MTSRKMPLYALHNLLLYITSYSPYSMSLHDIELNDF